MRFVVAELDAPVVRCRAFREHFADEIRNRKLQRRRLDLRGFLRREEADVRFVVIAGKNTKRFLVQHMTERTKLHVRVEQLEQVLLRQHVAIHDW